MSTDQFDVVTLSVRAEHLGVEDVVNVFDMQKTDATPADDASVLSDLEDWINLVFNIIAGFQAVTTLYREFKAINRTKQTLIGTGSITSPAAGDGTGGSHAPGVSALLSFPTAIGKVTGRKYLGGLVVGTMDTDGSVNSGTVTALITLANTIRAPFDGTTSNWQYVVVRGSDEVAHVPNVSLVTDVFAYQRRRKPGRGS